MSEMKTKCLIIGSGPAGYTAAIYASRANLNPVLYEGNQPGGQLTTTSEVENFPGYPNGINGTDMMMEIRQQAERFGTDIRMKTITEADLSKRPFRCVDESGDVIIADTIVVATGASAKYLGLPDEEKYRGLGVSACAVCDGFFYRKQDVAVVGGGDSACEEALYLSQICKKVYLIVRKDYLRASKVMADRVMAKDNIEVLFNTNTLGLFGDEAVDGAHLVRYAGTDKEEKFDIAITGFFLGIGRHPNTELVSKWVDIDELGYIKVQGATTMTNVEGVFAAGDVADPRYRQAIIAAGMGAKAGLDVEKFLTEQA